MKFLSVLAAGSQLRLRRFVVRVALALGSALSAAIGLGFGTYALFYAWRAQYGVIDASIGLGAIYFIASGILYLCYRRAGMSSFSQPNPALSPGLTRDAEALKAGAQAAGASQAAALALGVEVAKQLTPLQLAMLSVLTGFVAGRRL
jgi:hypothetical protein